MVIYAHRKNKFDDPKKHLALEIDLKAELSWDLERLVLGHGWNEVNSSFYEFLDECDSETELAINIKSAGLAKVLYERYLPYLEKLKSYFFFDMSVPDQIEFQKWFPTHTAGRISEYEENWMETEYIWFDYFDARLPFWNRLEVAVKSGAKVIVVSPELHSVDYKFDIKELEEYNVYGLCTEVK